MVMSLIKKDIVIFVVQKTKVQQIYRIMKWSQEGNYRIS